MKTGILITARLGSSRLERKHFLPVKDQPIIVFLIKRITEEFRHEIINNDVCVVIVTSDENENREFERFHDLGISVFYGSKENIPLRHLQAAESFSLDAIISVDGDDVLCSPTGMKNVYKSLTDGEQYVKTSELPFGMNSTGYSKLFLKKSLNQYSGDVLETDWGRIFDDTEIFNIPMPISTKNASLRFSLDYYDDYVFFETLIKSLGDKVFRVNDQDLIDYVINNRLNHLNISLDEMYWKNVNKLKNEEISISSKKRGLFFSEEDKS